MTLRTTLAVSLVLASSTALAFTSAKNGYSVTEPKGWTTLSGIAGPEVIYASPDRQANFNVIVSAATGLKSLDATTQKLVADQIEKQLKSTLANYKLVSRKYSTLAGLPSVEVIYTGGDNLQLFQAVTVKNEKTFVLTFTSPKSVFAKIQPTFVAVKNSFKFTR